MTHILFQSLGCINSDITAPDCIPPLVAIRSVFGALAPFVAMDQTMDERSFRVIKRADSFRFTRTLNLSFTDPDALAQLASSSESSSSCDRLDSLTLSFTSRIPELFNDSVIPNLLANDSLARYLRTLVLDGNDQLSSGALRPLSTCSAKSMCSLTRLDLGDCIALDDDALKYISHLPSLKMLDIHGNDNFSIVGMRSLVTANKKKERVRTSREDSDDDDDDDAEQAMTSAAAPTRKNMSELMLGRTRDTREDDLDLLGVAGSFENLKTLTIIQATLTNNDCVGLARCGATLRELCLMRCAGLTGAKFAKLGRYLKHLVKLELDSVLFATPLGLGQQPVDDDESETEDDESEDDDGEHQKNSTALVYDQQDATELVGLRNFRHVEVLVLKLTYDYCDKEPDIFYSEDLSHIVAMPALVHFEFDAGLLVSERRFDGEKLNWVEQLAKSKTLQSAEISDGDLNKTITLAQLNAQR